MASTHPMKIDCDCLPLHLEGPFDVQSEQSEPLQIEMHDGGRIHSVLVDVDGNPGEGFL